MSKLILYHGSNSIIKNPYYHGGKPINDYGYGFYCTENLELAKEWSCSNEEMNGFVNTYTLDTKGLRILNLTDKKYSILNWIAILLKNRIFDLDTEIAVEAKKYLLKHFYINTDNYDIVIGYRADDSYFSFARDFVNNIISVKQLSKAMELGKLGTQIVIISELAFSTLHFEAFEKVDQTEYFAKRKLRDDKARQDYLNRTRKSNTNLEDFFILDIIRRGIKNGDSTL